MRRVRVKTRVTDVTDILRRLGLHTSPGTVFLIERKRTPIVDPWAPEAPSPPKAADPPA